MAEGRSRASWGVASHVMALLANANRDSKRRPHPFEAADFNPYAETSSPKALKVSPGEMREALKAAKVVR